MAEKLFKYGFHYVRLDLKKARSRVLRTESGNCIVITHFAHCHPRSCGGKEQKANARLSANKKMTKENQIKTSPSLTKKEDKVVLKTLEEWGLQ